MKYVLAITNYFLVTFRDTWIAFVRQLLYCFITQSMKVLQLKTLILDDVMFDA